VGFLKGKRAVKIHRELLGERRMTGLHFWARGYCVSRAQRAPAPGRGYDEAAAGARWARYVREQEANDGGQEKLDLNLKSSPPKPQRGFPIVQCPILGAS